MGFNPNHLFFGAFLRSESCEKIGGMSRRERTWIPFHSTATQARWRTVKQNRLFVTIQCLESLCCALFSFYLALYGYMKLLLSISRDNQQGIPNRSSVRCRDTRSLIWPQRSKRTTTVMTTLRDCHRRRHHHRRHQNLRLVVTMIAMGGFQVPNQVVAAIRIWGDTILRSALEQELMSGIHKSKSRKRNGVSRPFSRNWRRFNNKDHASIASWEQDIVRICINKLSSYCTYLGYADASRDD